MEMGSDFSDHEKADNLWRSLSRLLEDDRRLCLGVITAWMEHHAAGWPGYELLEEETLAQARLWAAAASPRDLECYGAACIEELGSSSVITTRQIKRLAAAMYRRMDAETKSAFKDWINGQE